MTVVLPLPSVFLLSLSSLLLSFPSRLMKTEVSVENLRMFMHFLCCLSSSKKQTIQDHPRFILVGVFLDSPSHLYKRVCPSVRPSVRPSVSIKEKRGLGASYAVYPVLFLSLSFSFLDASSHLYMRVCPSVRPSVRPYVH